MAFFKPLNFSLYKTQGADFASICPYMIMIDEGIVLLKGGALACAYEFLAPDLASSSAAKINGIATMFNNAIIQLGKGWTVQFELQRSYSNTYPSSPFSNLAGYLIERQREINFSYSKAHFENHYFLIFTYQLPAEAEMKGMSVFYKKKSSAVSGTVKSKEMYVNEIRAFKLSCAKTVSVLSSVMPINPLDSDGLFTLLHSSVSLDWTKRTLPKDYALFIDKALTDCDLENSMPLKLGDHYIPIITVKTFPSQTYPAMFDAINKAQCPLRWSTRFICFSREEAEKRIANAEKKFLGQRKSLGQLAAEAVSHTKIEHENKAAMAEEADAGAARVELYMSNIAFGDYLSNIMVFDQDLDKAEDYARYISGVISACGFSAKIETHNALQAFCAMMPGNIYADSRSLFCSTGNLSHVIPSTSIWAGIQNNGFMNEISGNKRPLVVCGTEFGIPYFLNLNVKDVGHAWISGPTGSGKSTLLALIEAQFLKYPNSKVIIFDKDKSARNLTVSVGGNYIEPGKDETTFAPLATLDTPEDIRWASDFIEILLAEQNIAITPAMRKVIYNTIKLLATKTSGRDLTSFAQYCQYQNPETGHNDIVDGIAPYILGGQFANLFDSSEEAHIPITDWTMIEMGSLMNMSAAAVAPALFYLFHECEKKFDGSPTLLVLDEAWTFLKNPIFAQKIVEWLKTLRKKHVFVVFATQETDDASRSAIASTIVSQCPTKIFLADEQAETKMIRESYRNFGLEDSEIHLLTQMVRKHDYFYKSPLGTRLFQLNLDALQLAILTNDNAVVDAVETAYGRNSGKVLVEEILRAKKIDYRYLLEA